MQRSPPHQPGRARGTEPRPYKTCSVRTARPPSASTSLALYRIFSSSGGRGSPWSQQRSLPSPGARQRRCTGPETGDHRDHNGRRIVCAARARVRGIVKSRTRVNAAACGRTVRLGCRHRDTLGRCSGDGVGPRENLHFSLCFFFPFLSFIGYVALRATSEPLLWRFAPHQHIQNLPGWATWYQLGSVSAGLHQASARRVLLLFVTRVRFS